MNQKTTRSITPTRREFLATSLLAGGGLVLALSGAQPLRVVQAEADLTTFEPGAFVKIATDGTITIIAKHDEMGQGIHTGLAIAICEELEVDVDKVRVVPAPADTDYDHSAWRLQVTGGSSSTNSSLEQMRRAGATAREMLRQAAAKQWNVDVATCVAENGTIKKKDGSTSLGYGELAANARAIAVPADVPLKKAKDFTRIGKNTKRVDSPAKVRGTAVFGFDQRRPGMLTAMVARSPYFGGRVRRFDASDARAMPGVQKIVEVPSGIAVIADGYWNALKAREALRIDWDPGAGGAMDSDRLRADYRAKSRTKGTVAFKVGDADGTLDASTKRIDAIYESPFQAHAPMEPLNCMVELRDDGGASIVTGSQMLGGDKLVVAGRLGVDPSRVTIENSYLGGGFGRRANPASDFVLEAVEVALAARPIRKPIKTVWSREDDLKGGWYRPLYVNGMSAALENGKIVGWRHRIVGQSVATGTGFAALMIRDGIDYSSVEGAAEQPYAIPNQQVELHTTSLPIPIQWWRSVGHSNTAFAKEGFLDECAHALGRDPYELRRELLKDHPRPLRVLDLAAKKAGWGSKPAPGVGRGISVHESFQSFSAHVVEASVVDGKPKIHRVVCAVDCGPVVNPDQVKAQMEGGAIFALSATLNAAITLTNGRVDQENFDEFDIIRLHESPAIEVHIVDSDAEMGGIGEVGVPGIPSAVVDALHAACGKRIRRLPIGDQLAD